VARLKPGDVQVARQGSLIDGDPACCVLLQM
jgi:hypothetical protein